VLSPHQVFDFEAFPVRHGFYQLAGIALVLVTICFQIMVMPSLSCETHSYIVY
jgi:hypothetical protein